MAFLDNSGDIILDAVLTDLGREEMAAGDFSVKYFALGDDEIDYSEYATTDFAVLAGQLRNLWRFLPAEGPRIVFAWSEGTLHVRALLIGEIDAVVLLGGISTNIGDIIQAQGGPPPYELRRELVGKDRREIGGEHPVDGTALVECLDDVTREAVGREQFGGRGGQRRCNARAG